MQHESLHIVVLGFEELDFDAGETTLLIWLDLAYDLINMYWLNLFGLEQIDNEILLFLGQLACQILAIPRNDRFDQGRLGHVGSRYDRLERSND